MNFYELFKKERKYIILSKKMYQFNSICKQINFCYFFFYRKQTFTILFTKNIKIQSNFINTKKKFKKLIFTKLI